MAKSQHGTSTTPNESEAASAGTVASSRSSRKSARKRTSNAPGLSDSDLINILMVDLNRVQERFGEVHFLRPEGDEPAIFVLPKKLDVCANEKCGMIILRTGDVSYCEAHAVKELVPA